jgi:hypothetical protein
LVRLFIPCNVLMSQDPLNSDLAALPD